MAAALVARFTKKGDVVYDPFSGCGTLAFEAWAAGRNVIANDLSPYAHLLTTAKLFPYISLHEALCDLERVGELVKLNRTRPDLRKVPRWVRRFFHRETLREILTWVELLKEQDQSFLLACLLGILHHQRPGFLSFPSSHTVPYLRDKKFPPSRFPDLYAYRSVADRLEAKVRRAFRRVPRLSSKLHRACHMASADTLLVASPMDTILTSPPYMRQLDYARDNRLRLWFLGHADWETLDDAVSPGEQEFLDLMARCFRLWRSTLKADGNCVLVIGDTCSRENHDDLAASVVRIAVQEGGFALMGQVSDTIPNERRVRRGITGSSSETIVILRNSPTAV